MYVPEIQRFTECIADINMFLGSLAKLTILSQGDLGSYIVQTRQPDFDEPVARFGLHSMRIRGGPIDVLEDNAAGLTFLIMCSAYPSQVKVAYISGLECYIDTLRSMESVDPKNYDDCVDEARKQLALLEKINESRIKFFLNSQTIATMDLAEYIEMGQEDLEKNLEPLNKSYEAIYELRRHYYGE